MCSSTPGVLRCWELWPLLLTLTGPRGPKSCCGIDTSPPALPLASLTSRTKEWEKEKPHSPVLCVSWSVTDALRASHCRPEGRGKAPRGEEQNRVNMDQRRECMCFSALSLSPHQTTKILAVTDTVIFMSLFQWHRDMTGASYEVATGDQLREAEAAIPASSLRQIPRETFK